MHIHQPTVAEIWLAISEQANGMLYPPISNIGMGGIRKAAQMVSKWANTLPAD